MNNFHEKFMMMALEQAYIAYNLGEIPVGSIIVKDDIIIGVGYNTRENQNNPTGHAEINAIIDACKHLGNWRLDDCSIYVTLEPCPMCAGAIINARISHVIYGATDDKWGSFGSVCDLSAMKFGNTPYIKSGILKEKCLNLLQDFFTEIR